MQLDKFYQEFQAWIDSGFSNSTIFTPIYGLCGNALRWARAHNLAHIEFLNSLKEQFLDAGLDYEYPFNEDYADYDHESWSDSLYTNEKRLKWVKDHAQVN